MERGKKPEKKIENGTQTVVDLKYGKKTDQLRKRENHLVGHRMW